MKIEIAPDTISLIVSILAATVAYLAYRQSQQAIGIQTFMRYFESNNFQLDNWKTVSILTPLGKSTSRQEAVIRVYLLHRINRFKWENDRRQRKAHKIYARTVLGSNLEEFQVILIRQGGNKRFAQTSAKVLSGIRFKDPYFSTDHKFWNEYFGPKYFNSQSQA